MPLATFKDLVIDANDAERLGRFWAAALGLNFEALDDGDVRLTGPSPAHTVWVNTVPEKKTAKNRLHLDVHAASVDELVALGASVEQEFPKWTVMRDPEGGEFCAFVRDEPPAYRMYELVLDTGADPRPVAQWWGDVLGATVGFVEDDGFSYIENVPGLPFEGICFGPVPEPKTAKNRVHIDVTTDDVAALIERGARVLQELPGWTVLADPEGNEFCAFARRD